MNNLILLSWWYQTFATSANPSLHWSWILNLSKSFAAPWINTSIATLNSYYRLIIKAKVQSFALPVALFSITAVNYFIMSSTYTLPLLGQVLVKIAPIVSLIWFVSMHIAFGKTGQVAGWKLLLGLVFSCIGDALLVHDDMFLFGMLAFALAQISYITALGFNQLKLALGALVYAAGVLVTPKILPLNDTVLQYCIPLYGFLLSTMGWRALALCFSKSPMNWNRALVGAGGILWMISDSVLAYNEFNQPVPYAKVIVMSTYYAGQMGIASSVFLE